jgi:hypothetical protein
VRVSWVRFPSRNPTSSTISSWFSHSTECRPSCVGHGVWPFLISCGGSLHCWDAGLIAQVNLPFGERKPLWPCGIYTPRDYFTVVSGKHMSNVNKHSDQNQEKASQGQGQVAPRLKNRISSLHVMLAA